MDIRKQNVKKFSVKSPAWYKEKSAKTQSASLNVEVSLTSFDPMTLGIDVTLLQAQSKDTLPILHKKTCGFGTQVQIRI